MKMGAERKRATTRVAPTKGLTGPFSYQSLMSVFTDITNHENGQGRFANRPYGRLAGGIF